MNVNPFAGFTDLPDLSLWRQLWLGLKLIYHTSFIWLPILLGTGAWKLWLTYKQTEFNLKQKPTLLEITLPPDVYKSPLSMEIFYSALFQTGGEGTWIARYIEGKSRPWFSLELVSLEGKVRFFLWTRSMWKNHIEAQLYAQFPGVEINEVEDYTLPVAFDPEKLVVWGCEFDLAKPDPLPIRTWVDPAPHGFGMALFPGTPMTYQTDPMSVVIEYLASLGMGEQAWIQILIRAHKADRKSKDYRWWNPLTWGNQADWKQDFKKLFEEYKAREADKKKSPSDDDLIKTIERSMSKFPFETGIRALYIAEKSHFNPVNISGLAGSFRQYSSNNLNGFKPARGLTVFNYPWQDYKNIRQNSTRRQLIDAYKRRSYFMSPYKSPHFILNTEELATIYHLPSIAITTPSLNRATSKKGEPPRDLPI